MKRASAISGATFENSLKAIRNAPTIYKNVSKGVASGGIEWYLPLFFD